MKKPFSLARIALLFVAPCALSAQDAAPIPVYAADIAQGEYEVTVESSASMFRVSHAALRVSDEAMTARLTMGGKGYSALYLGSAEEASEASQSEIIPVSEDADGTYYFTIPVSALNQPFACASLSKKRNLWYDRQLVIDASSLPSEALSVTPHEAQKIALKDGLYDIDVTLSGGSGKAHIKSPTRLTVADGTAHALIEWGSAHYDYMLVNRERYDADISSGVSQFVIPVFAFDTKMPVIADTTAMSKSHEIRYELDFTLDSARKVGSVPVIPLVCAGIVCVLLAILIIRLCKKKR